MRSRVGPEPTFYPLVWDEPRFCCPGAEHFSQWIDRLIAGITQSGTKQPTHSQLKEAKVLLVDEYQKARNGATKAHRDRLLNKAGRPCIHGVFIATIDRLAELTIDPPKIPPVPPSAKAVPSKRRRQQQQEAQRFFGLPAFEVIPDE